MKLKNCINCCCHSDNRKDTECLAKKHRYIISDKQADKYNWAIGYVKKETANGRDITASLGSAGFTFIDDIEMLANYAYSIDDKEFYELVKN